MMNEPHFIYIFSRVEYTAKDATAQAIFYVRSLENLKLDLNDRFVSQDIIKDMRNFGIDDQDWHVGAGPHIVVLSYRMAKILIDAFSEKWYSKDYLRSTKTFVSQFFDMVERYHGRLAKSKPKKLNYDYEFNGGFYHGVEGDGQIRSCARFHIISKDKEPILSIKVDQDMKILGIDDRSILDIVRYVKIYTEEDSIKLTKANRKLSEDEKQIHIDSIHNFFTLVNGPSTSLAKKIIEDHKTREDLIKEYEAHYDNGEDD